MRQTDHPTRRQFLAATAIAAATGVSRAQAAHEKALVAITLDLEMSRNFPAREDMHWDFEKGNLNAETKAYTVEACRRVKAAGGVLHCFAVGQVFEQEDVEWLK
ncbi:MAG: twin-arginine translocation signal domain-containing protein, partial [Myxococcaceae bacterium]